MLGRWRPLQGAAALVAAGCSCCVHLKPLRRLPLLCALGSLGALALQGGIAKRAWELWALPDARLGALWRLAPLEAAAVTCP